MSKIWVFCAALITAWLPGHQALAVCHLKDTSRVAVIRKWGGEATQKLLRIYQVEGRGCYIGDAGTSFGPFQLHYGGRHNSRGNREGGMGDVFTRQTGLNARNESTVPAQVRFMRRWGSVHHGFSSDIWHGLRCHNCYPQAFWHHHHGRRWRRHRRLHRHH